MRVDIVADTIDSQLLSRAGAAASAVLGPARVSDLHQLPGGVSSVTYAGLLHSGSDERKVVLKVAPRGLAPVRNRDVLRQARIITLLADIPGVAVPQVIFEDVGEHESGRPPFFAMEFVPGQSYEPGTDSIPEPPAPDVVRDRVKAAAATLARIQAVTPAELGIGDEPVTSPAQELERWSALLATVDPDVAPGHDALGGRLQSRVPDARPTRLLHGDYRLANMLFEGPSLRAIIDWEIWSVGDPRHDLAWLVMHLDPPHVRQGARSAADDLAGSGLPSRGQLVGDYRAAAPAWDENILEDLDWFLALCHYKVVSTVAAIDKRNRKMADPDPLVEELAATIPRVIERAHDILDRA